MNSKRINIASIFLAYLGFFGISCAQRQADTSGNALAEFPPVITDPANYNPLEGLDARVLLEEGTEFPFTGAYHALKAEGTYICKQCNQPLFRSEDKFKSGTGWPSFDDFIEGSVKEITDKDGRRTEIECSNCEGHLGHVFKGEGFTAKSTRHCVNSASLNFVSKEIQ